MANNPVMIARNRTIAEARASGLTYRELSKKFKMSKGHLFHILSKPEQREILDIATQQKVNMVPRAVEVLWGFLTGSDPKYKFKAMTQVFNDTGIGDAHTRPANIQVAVFQDNRTIDESRELPIVQAMLGDKRYRDIQEAEIVEDEGHNEAHNEGSGP